MFEDLVAKIDYFAKDNPWIQRQNRFFHSGKCEGPCGRSDRKLTYAHKDPSHSDFPEDIKGTGRGENVRTLHFIKYPEKYHLLCPECHSKQEKYYKKHETMEGFPIAHDTIKRDRINQLNVKRERKKLPKQSEVKL